MLILLDIDGVMVPAKSWDRPELLDDGFPAFSSKSIEALREIVDADTTIVLTTTHRHRFTIEQWEQIFRRRGLNVGSIEILAANSGSLNRRGEIESWYITNTREDFVILDDD